jgi:plastocyanin
MRRGSFSALLAGLVACVPMVSAAEEIAGRVALAFEGARLADLGPTVVFLTPADGETLPAAPAAGAPPTIRQRDARFEPEFLVVTAGQGVVMPNDDSIFHNVFSFSRPNDFDLGVYPSGESRRVVFEHPGVVKLYCSIHESMSAAILVTPSPYHATVSRSGHYRIEDVPAGAYTLTVWNEKLPRSERDVDVSGSRPVLVVDVLLGEQAAFSAAR